MGLFDSALNVVGAGDGLKGIALGGPVGKYAPGSLTAPYFSQPGVPGQPVNPVDPRIQQIRDQQLNDANDYANNLDATRNSEYGVAEDSSRRQLAKDLAGDRTNANSRGMLYGSYEQGQEANSTGRNASALASAKTNINTDTQNTLNSLQNQALGSGMASNQADQDFYNQAYQRQLTNSQQKSNAFGNLASGGGSGLGLLGSGSGRLS